MSDEDLKKLFGLKITDWDYCKETESYELTKNELITLEKLLESLIKTHET